MAKSILERIITVSYTHLRAHETRISKIGIENIKQSKLQRLEREHDKWLREFNSNQKVIPSIQQLLTIKING